MRFVGLTVFGAAVIQSPDDHQLLLSDTYIFQQPLARGEPPTAARLRFGSAVR
jgi:hypothetical protein